jgi:phosphoglycolate phosphatase-like HAD superfamily hydrolase
MPEDMNGTTLDRGPAFLFDLDGTLVDSVYQHVLAWREALEAAGIELAVWRIHRRIGMSGGLFLNALLRETDRCLTPEEVGRVQQIHADAFKRLVQTVRALPGARDLLTYLSQAGVPYAIATSGRREFAYLSSCWISIIGSQSLHVIKCAMPNPTPTCS